MRLMVYPWMGKEFIALCAEGKPGLPADQAARELLDRFDGLLKERELSLDHTVRSRLWGRDREARGLGSLGRVAILSGRARSASSSYIAPDHFESDAAVALDLWAMRPARAGAQKSYEFVQWS